MAAGAALREVSTGDCRRTRAAVSIAGVKFLEASGGAGSSPLDAAGSRPQNDVVVRIEPRGPSRRDVRGGGVVRDEQRAFALSLVAQGGPVDPSRGTPFAGIENGDLGRKRCTFGPGQLGNRRRRRRDSEAERDDFGAVRA